MQPSRQIKVNGADSISRANLNLSLAKTHLFGKSLIFSEEAETLSE
jgi:hypothetical protein